MSEGVYEAALEQAEQLRAEYPRGTAMTGNGPRKRAPSYFRRRTRPHITSKVAIYAALGRFVGAG